MVMSIVAVFVGAKFKCSASFKGFAEDGLHEAFGELFVRMVR